MIEIKTGLCVLITNAFIQSWTGSELYIHDVAIELIKRGHKPMVYSPRIGELAEVLRKKSIPVVKDLNSISVKPDLIHGQHHMETMTVLSQFPGTPAVYFCHGWLPWEETPPFHPRIIQYVTVSDALHDRLIYECGIPAEKITTILNSVDLEKFKPRQPLPTIPKRALVFNNRANEANIMGIVREACARNDIIVDAVGYANGNPISFPEARLGNYDIIFAVGRAALESLATGATVICCGLEGAGQMVTTKNLEWLRHNNFGIRVLNRPLTADILSAEIQLYNPLDAQKVSREVRATAGLSDMVDQILSVYNTTLNSWTKNHQQDPIAESQAFSAYLKGISDRVDQTIVESNLAHEKARALQDELDLIKSGLVWRLYQRIIRISFVRNLYLMLITPIRRWRARKKKIEGE
ncbi:MAG: glycosyltransferase [Chloroflexi bacterium]|nr:glycosyltransferase [Chloroflexota bacterium]